MHAHNYTITQTSFQFTAKQESQLHFNDTQGKQQATETDTIA